MAVGRRIGNSRRYLFRGFALLLLPVMVILSLGCGTSDEDVARAAERSISSLASLAVANLGCSVSGAFSGDDRASDIMERFTDRMDDLTAGLQPEGDASNREKMKLITEMDELYEQWKGELESAGCEVSEP